MALDVLQIDLIAGHQYDGELASALARLPCGFWKDHAELARRIAKILQAGKGDLDEDVREEVQEFLARHDS